MVSSFRDRAIPQDWMAFGEVGLSGEIRPVPSGLERINQAARQGFRYCVCPSGNAPKSAPEGITVFPVETLNDALEKFEEI